ncbi:MAG TPA: tetratricopeptide repeat protein, partial [Polyangiaceae bacterium]|nr:tetratricopeptide repeat protein [Polyangiaceae bacterium]
PIARGAAFQARGMQALVSGDAAAHVEFVSQSAEGFEQGGDLRSASLARVNVGYGLLVLGDPRGAQDKLEAALLWSEPLGLGYVTAAARHNLGMALAYQGRLPEAIALETQAIEEGLHLGDKRLEGASRIYLGLMLADSGDLAGAEREARRAIELLEVAAPVRMHALAALAHVLVRAGRHGEALGVALEGMETLEGIGDVEEGEALMRLSYARALEASGDVAGARRELLAARERVLHSAAKIQDAATRERFLSGIPEHRQILESAARFEA